MALKNRKRTDNVLTDFSFADDLIDIRYFYFSNSFIKTKKRGLTFKY